LNQLDCSSKLGEWFQKAAILALAIPRPGCNPYSLLQSSQTEISRSSLDQAASSRDSGSTATCYQRCFPELQPKTFPASLFTPPTLGSLFPSPGGFLFFHPILCILSSHCSKLSSLNRITFTNELNLRAQSPNLSSASFLLSSKVSWKLCGFPCWRSTSSTNKGSFD